MEEVFKLIGTKEGLVKQGNVKKNVTAITHSFATSKNLANLTKEVDLLFESSNVKVDEVYIIPVPRKDFLDLAKFAYNLLNYKISPEKYINLLNQAAEKRDYNVPKDLPQ